MIIVINIIIDIAVVVLGVVAQFCAYAISVISTVDIWINGRDFSDGPNKTNTFFLSIIW